MLTFDIVNDESHLYLFFMSNDPKEISKIVSSGWQIQLSSKEKNKKFSSVLSVPPVDFGEQQQALKGPDDKNTANEFKVLVSKYKLQLTGIVTKGFKTKNGELPLTQPDGINVGISSDSLLNLCY